ncbi:hypothetical protein [Marinilabilia sp.]|uniref:hypothetical protein n=1 Tax=Marinilabilia sp. TaxID=2021252 RepID=UPI0025BE67DC|nr:hypothetical protein [Marinilabilia sp.]
MYRLNYLFGLLIISINLFGQTTNYNSPSGEIILTSSEYGNNLTRQYNISTGEDGLVELVLDYNVELDYDYIYVFDCDESFNKINRIAAFHGTNESIIKTTNPNGRVVIVFETDGAYNGDNIGSDAGYRIIWNSFSANDISLANRISDSGQVLVGSVDSEPNLTIQDYQNKSLGNLNEQISNFENSMVLLETEYGEKLGISYNRIGTNSDLGISSNGVLSSFANEFSFGTPINEDAFKISATGRIGINNPNTMSALISGRISGVSGEKFARFNSSTEGYGMYLGNGGGDVGTTFLPNISGYTKDNTAALCFTAEHMGDNSGKRGIMTFDGRQNGKGASGEAVVFEYCSGYGNRLAHITGAGSFFVIKDIEAAGTIRAAEVKVEAGGNTADFVFEDDYELKDLKELESFIKDNKHLPDIPSAKEMEASGINLAEMNKLLLQKIEELTLYVIEQDSQLDRKNSFVEELNTTMEMQKTEVKELKEKNRNLVVRMEKIEELLMNGSE